MADSFYEPNDSFPFQDLVLLTPKSLSGGHYFSRFHIRDSPVFIQIPKCVTKAGIQTSGTNAKKAYCELQFTSDQEKFLRWIEKLVERIQDVLVENRQQWFETEMDRSEIEETFQNPLKPYKSGQFYLMRINVAIKMGKILLPMFNEEETHVEPDYLKPGQSILGILEIQGLKYSSKSLQIEMEMKQVLCLASQPLFEKCILLSKPSGSGGGGSGGSGGGSGGSIAQPKSNEISDILAISKMDQEPVTFEVKIDTEPFSPDPISTQENEVPSSSSVLNLENSCEENVVVAMGMETEPVEKEQAEVTQAKPESSLLVDDLETVELSLDTMTLEPLDQIQIKNGKEIYYKMYREARQKAKLARDLAISSYLESKHIKNIYVLEDLSDEEDEAFFSLSLTKKSEIQ